MDMHDVPAAAELLYVNPNDPGIRRRRAGRGFSYLRPSGLRVTDDETLERIRGLAIPPSWSRVWICLDARGHIQATGRDQRQRKQYRYHPAWQQTREDSKFSHTRHFGEALSAIRARVANDLGKPGLPREKVIAGIVRLLDLTALRIGNDEYARDNHSFGLTTLRHRHVDVSGGRVHFQFRAKSGKDADVEVADRKISRLVKKCQDLPGHELFRYLDDNGKPHRISSSEVNAYLQETTGERFTAKDFRTWAGTVMAVRALGRALNDGPAKSCWMTALKEASRHLGNTVSVCRKHYIHPAVFEAYQRDQLRDLRARMAKTGEQGAADAGLLAYLETYVLNLLQDFKGDAFEVTWVQPAKAPAGRAAGRAQRAAL